MAINDIIGMLTGNPMGQQADVRAFADPMQARMAFAQQDIQATGQAGRAVGDAVRSLFSGFLPERELTREEQFTQMLDGIDDLGSEEGFNQFLNAYAMVDPFAVDNIRRQREADARAQQDLQLRQDRFDLDKQNTESIIGERDRLVNEKLESDMQENMYRTSLVEQLPDGGNNNPALVRQIMTAPLSAVGGIFEKETKSKAPTNIATVFTEEGQIVRFGVDENGNTVSIGGGIPFDPNETYYTSNPRLTDTPAKPIVVRSPDKAMRKTYDTYLKSKDDNLTKIPSSFFGGADMKSNRANEIIYQAEAYRLSQDGITPQQAIDYVLGTYQDTVTGQQSGDRFDNVTLDTAPRMSGRR